MDPANPVVQLCARGMQAEFAGRLAEASAHFAQAWQAAADDYEACVAAHFVARHQADPRDALRWNQVALARAQAVPGERVRGFYPSLYLNLGYAYENVGDMDNARQHYALAAERLVDLDDGPYAEVVRGGVAAGLARTGPENEAGP